MSDQPQPDQYIPPDWFTLMPEEPIPADLDADGVKEWLELHEEWVPPANFTSELLNRAIAHAEYDAREPLQRLQWLRSLQKQVGKELAADGKLTIGELVKRKLDTAPEVS